MIIDRDYVASCLRYEDGRLYWTRGMKAGAEAGCKRKSDGRVLIRLGGRKGPLILRYRLIYLLVNGFMPAGEIDHINGDPSDDRVENLREATSAQQKWNRARCVSNKAGAKGVIPYGDRYTAQICVDGKSTHLGVFDTVEEASAAYMRRAVSIAGEFARGG